MPPIRSGDKPEGDKGLVRQRETVDYTMTPKGFKSRHERKCRLPGGDCIC